MDVPTSVLRKARESAGINQTEMARRLDVSSNSVISRLEKTEFTDQSMAEQYLRAIDTEDSLAMLDFYSRNWSLSKRPDYRHPDREALWKAEQALQDLAAFAGSENFDTLLTAPLNFVQQTLTETADYVARTDHVLAWIGAIGVGKTTALSHLTNLVLPGNDGRPKPIFPATGGRTTSSEVVVKAAPAYGIAVEPKSEDEVRLLVRELVDSIGEGKAPPSTELERAIRNMADLAKQKDPTDPKVLHDPIKSMIEAPPHSREDVVHAIVSRMNIELRTETQMIMSGDATSGLEWLSKAAADINYGRHPRFSLPQRVTVFLPKSVMRRTGYDITIVDTKGIHGTTDRVDLQKLMSEPRTLSILCSTFNDAPNSEALSILKGLKDMGSDALERQRVALLVLPRGDEAMKVTDDHGEPVSSPDEGYAFRSSQIESSFKEAGVPSMPILYFNAMGGEAAAAWSAISNCVDQIRTRQLDRLARFSELAIGFQSNADAHRFQQARATLVSEAKAIATDYAELPTSIRSAQQRLLTELGASHPSSIAAAALRNGTWYNFDVHHIVGVGVRSDANLRTRDHVQRIKGRLDSLRTQFGPAPEALALLDKLVEDLADWHQEFLTRALSIGRNVFKSHLDEDATLWTDLRRRYGQGLGYREDIGRMMEAWFEAPERNAAREKIDAWLKDAWQEQVLAKIVESAELESALD